MKKCIRIGISTKKNAIKTKKIVKVMQIMISFVMLQMLTF